MRDSRKEIMDKIAYIILDFSYNIAKSSANTASIFGMYQPKEPDSLRCYKKR